MSINNRTETLKVFNQIGIIYSQWQGMKYEQLHSAAPLINKINSLLPQLNLGQLTANECNELFNAIQVIGYVQKPISDSETLSSVETLQNLQNISEKTKVEIVKKTNREYEQRGLVNGICNGYVLALAEQPTPVPEMATEVRARYIQGSYELNRALTRNDLRELGRKVLTQNSEARPLILKKAAERLGFTDNQAWVQSKLGTTDLEKQLNCESLLNIIGNVTKELAIKYGKINSLPMPEKTENEEIYNQRVSDRMIAVNLKMLCNGVKVEKADFEDPALFLKNSPLIQKEKIITNETNRQSFVKQLELALDKPGNYRMGFAYQDKGHFYYLSFNPEAEDGSYKFLDINDRTIDGTPIIRTFSTKKEMLQYVLNYTLKKNPEAFKTPTSSSWSLHSLEKRKLIEMPFISKTAHEMVPLLTKTSSYDTFSEQGPSSLRSSVEDLGDLESILPKECVLP